LIFTPRPATDLAIMGAMPIYEFRCPACGHSFEELLRAGQIPACPACGHRKTNQKVSLFATPRSPIPAISELGGASAASPAQGSRASAGFAMEGSATLINCSAHGGKVGVKIGKGARVQSRGLRVSGARVGIENEGSFDGPDTIIK